MFPNHSKVFSAARLFALSYALIAASNNVFAWGDEGHEVIATIAFQSLSAPVKHKVKTLLNGDPVSSTCGGGNFVIDAVWPDKLRAKPVQCSSGLQHGNTQPWHFLDIPVTAPGYDHARDCGQDTCVVAKIEEFQKLLADQSRPKEERRDALKFLIHFVGDIHQPLHTTAAPFDLQRAEAAAGLGAGENKCLAKAKVDPVSVPHDRGGNCVDVRYKGKATELHAFWDTDVVKAISPAVATVVTKVMQGVTAADIKALQTGSVEDWTNEAHQIAVNVVYGKLPASPMPQLQGAYVNAAKPVTTVQLRRAGARLAGVIEEALK